MFLNDQETSTDLLYYEAIARTVVRFIQETPCAPVTIGVHGDWGAGKSSVLKMTESALKGKDRVLCLWFNGWTFEGFEDAKTVLIETLIDELRRARPTSTKVADAAKKLLKRVDWLKLARKSGGLALTTLTGIPSPGQLGGVIDMVSAFVKKPQDQISVDDLKSFAGQAQEYVKEPNEAVDRIPEHIHAFRKEFEELLDAAELDRLVVIVDDLDRCLPHTAIATLEAIRLFLMVDRTAFVIGADELMIEYAVKEHFPDLPPSSGPVGYARNYLEKLIQVPFRVPALGLSETRVYITLLLAELALPKGDAGFLRLLEAARKDMQRPWQSRGLDTVTIREALGPVVPDKVQEAQTISSVLSKILTEGTHGNPRQIKRFLNSMMLRRAIAEERGFGDEIKLPVLGKIMLAERFYPDLYKQLAQLAAAEGGKPASLVQFERSLKPLPTVDSAAVKTVSKPVIDVKQSAAKSGDATALSQEATDWMKVEWIKGWAAIDPPLSDVDLRPYVFVTRDKRGSLGGLAVSAHLENLIERLMGGKIAARSCVAEVSKLSPQELDDVFTAVSDQALQADDLSTEPSGIQGLMVLSEHTPEMGRRLIEFAKSLNLPKVGLWPANMVANIKHPQLLGDVNSLISQWVEQTESTKLRTAAKLVLDLAKKG
ncbi:MAG: NTPase KAP [Burkholderiales bacterium PBB3]|nr:MAG: NTPase KAP [Burkholderiales bacterium PBB3]